MPLSKEKKEQIRCFLEKVRHAVDMFSNDQSIIHVYDRKEFTDTISFFCWKMDDVLDILYNLNAGDYYRGPTDNRNNPNLPQVWEFNYHYRGRDIYIKLSYGDHNEGKDSLLILSMHIDRIDLFRMRKRGAL